MLIPSSNNRKYKTLSPRVRVAIGAGVMTYATVALYASDAAEKMFGLEAGEDDKKRLGALLPKIQAVESSTKRTGD